MLMTLGDYAELPPSASGLQTSSQVRDRPKSRHTKYKEIETGESTPSSRTDDRKFLKWDKPCYCWRFFSSFLTFLASFFSFMVLAGSFLADFLASWLLLTEFIQSSVHY